MSSRPDFRCRAVAHALVVALGVPAGPAGACVSMTVGELAERLPGAVRFEAGAELLPPLLLLWHQRRADSLPARPDGVALFATTGQPLLLAYRAGDCLLGLLPAAPGEVWRTLRERLGPVA